MGIAPEIATIADETVRMASVEQRLARSATPIIQSGAEKRMRMGWGGASEIQPKTLRLSSLFLAASRMIRHIKIYPAPVREKLSV